MEPIKIPDTLKNAPSDYVNFKYEGSKSKEREELNRPCYNSIMPSLSDLIIRLSSHNDKNTRLPKDYYLAWMELCKTNKLIPPDTEVSIDENNVHQLNLLSTGYDKHWVYATLCCYRFADAYAPMVWQIVEHVNASKDFTFWQALHFGFATHYTYGSGHSFSYLCSSTSPYAPWGNLDLSQSIAIKDFYSLTVDQRKKKNGATNDCINEVAQSLGGCPRYDPYGRVTKTGAGITISNLNELLTDKFTELYLIKTNIKDEYKRIIDQTKSQIAA